LPPLQTTYLPKIHVNIIFSLSFSVVSGRVSEEIFLIKIVYAFPIFPILHICPEQPVKVTTVALQKLNKIQKHAGKHTILKIGPA
jgi:hypothetical protein